MSAARMQYKRWGHQWLRLSQCYKVRSFGLNDLLGPWKSGNMDMWAGFHLSNWKLDIQAKWVTWQWAKVTCGKKSHLSYQSNLSSDRLSYLSSFRLPEEYQTKNWEQMNFGKLEYWTVGNFLLCHRKIPQDSHKQLLNKQGCFGNDHCRCVVFSSVSPAVCSFCTSVSTILN